MDIDNLIDAVIDREGGFSDHKADRGGATRFGVTERVARAEGVNVAADRIEQIDRYVAGIPGSMRSSLLIDLEFGKRIEVEALQGAAIRRAANHGLPMPIISTLYAALRPWSGGDPRKKS